uniref:Fibronectin type III domain containing 11 n=2 Tax=Xenopus tropicalis TaxID=8364 RepID=A0A803JP03_XENTR
MWASNAAVWTVGVATSHYRGAWLSPMPGGCQFCCCLCVGGFPADYTGHSEPVAAMGKRITPRSAMAAGGGNMQSSAPCLVEEEQTAEDMMAVAQRRKWLVSKFLREELSESFLKRQQGKVEQLRRCSFYMEILSGQAEPEEEELQSRLPISVFQFIDPEKFQRMKNMAASQTKLQLLLLEKLLEQLERGRAALVGMVTGGDSCGWGRLWQGVSHLHRLQKDFLHLLVPRRLHLKHQLVANTSAAKIPPLRLGLRLRNPVVFDRAGSVAFRDRVSLAWRSLGQPCPPEKYELGFRLREEEEAEQGAVSVSGNHLEIHNLLSDRLYEFHLRRADTHMLVYQAWHDSITLRTCP